MTILGLIAVALGLWALVITYILAPKASKKEGHNVSGIPGVGGILLIAGFLLTPWKIFALSGAVEIVYILICIGPDIVGLMIDNINWMPPEDLEGELVAFTSYKNRYEEIRGDDLPNGGYMVNPVVRYVITKTDDGYRLYLLDMASRVVACKAFRSEEECKSATVKQARNKWKVK